MPLHTWLFPTRCLCSCPPVALFSKLLWLSQVCRLKLEGVWYYRVQKHVPSGSRGTLGGGLASASSPRPQGGLFCGWDAAFIQSLDVSGPQGGVKGRGCVALLIFDLSTGRGWGVRSGALGQCPCGKESVTGHSFTSPLSAKYLVISALCRCFRV